MSVHFLRLNLFHHLHRHRVGDGTALDGRRDQWIKRGIGSLMFGFRLCLMRSVRLFGSIEPIPCGQARLLNHAHPIFSHREPRCLVRRIPGPPRHPFALFGISSVFVGLAHNRRNIVQSSGSLMH